MKVTDKDILKAVWRATVLKLPYTATHHYVGDLRGLAPTDEYWHQSATQICTVSRGYVLNIPLSPSQSLRRIKLLVERQRLVMSLGVPGGSFYFKLPDLLTRPAYDLTRQLLQEHGMTEKKYLPIHGYTDIANKVSSRVESQLAPLADSYIRRSSRFAGVEL
ncbi:hypothetical protein [Citrobacter cronae]|uniref:hypothetical protein n=1 Tax=Citrobacter cronae TaxID=1748967 RepID=UPI001866EA35|nr:hypothetical protein [Citrobacter cronae]